MNVLPQSFYLRGTEKVARELLGQTLCVRTDQGIQRSCIVETEAYLGVTDRACHSFGGRRTSRVEAMYLPGGHSYVYLIYGMYYCLNAVTQGEDCPEAVLIRAVQPLPAVETQAQGAKLPTNGPGKLCRHYEITKNDDRLKLYSNKSRVFIEAGSPLPMDSVIAKSRVGIDYAQDARDWLLRFYIKNNAYVSRK